MSGDSLTIRLSLLGFALSLGLQAMSAAGLNSQFLIYALSAAATATFAMALFWPVLLRQSAALVNLDNFVERMIGRRFLAITLVICAFLPALHSIMTLAQTQPSTTLAKDTSGNPFATSLFQAFQENCSNNFTLSSKLNLVLRSGSNDKTYVVYAQECLNPYSKSKSYAFYVPSYPEDEQVIKELPIQYQKAFQELEASHPNQTWELGDNESISSYQLTFSGWIDVYHERRLPLEDIKSLERAFRNVGIEVRFWGAD